MKTYEYGPTLQCARDITKNDIIKLCKLLNKKVFFKGKCTFRPAKKVEGGIEYVFDDNRWYKSIRFCRNDFSFKWPNVSENVMTDWYKNKDIIYEKQHRFDTFLKAFHGAPVFTKKELEVWKDCLMTIGLHVK